jgi:integrase
MFRWGVLQELVSPITADALKFVPPLREGRTEAPESTLRTDVPDVVVDATLPHLVPTVAVMGQVQRLATMRPNEVCRMRVGDIDMKRKDGIWLYKPPKHKGSWRGYKKIVPLGKPEQALILPYLEGKSPESAVFSPKTAMVEKWAKDAKRRKTKISPSQALQMGQRKSNPRKEAREHYDSQSYDRSIKQAIEIANRTLPKGQQIPHWTPYQLRHAGITELIAEHDGDRDIARAVAGQKSISVTQGYNHADLRIAIEQAKKRGSSPEEQPESRAVK